MPTLSLIKLSIRVLKIVSRNLGGGFRYEVEGVKNQVSGISFKIILIK